MARYVGWPRVQVMLAVGWIEEKEIDQVISQPAAVQQALKRIQEGSLSSGLRTPLDRASPDHQILMARLLLAAEAAALEAGAHQAGT